MALCSEGGGKSGLTVSEDPTLYLYRILERGAASGKGCGEVAS